VSARILLDSCVWGGAISPLQAFGHDVIWTGNWEEDPGDTLILDHAFREKRVLVTLDKDFGELAILKGQPHSGIIRLQGFRVTQMASAVHQLVMNYHLELQNGAIVTADPDRVRIRSGNLP
jgi:predicted nuclease of predicted toxin-antitoxin system